MPYKRSPLQSGRVRTPAPTADVKAFLFFRRGRTLAGPLKGFCHSGPTLIRLAYARHLLPRREKAFRRLIAAPAVRRKPAGAHIMRPSSYTPGALARQTQAHKWDRTSGNFCKPRAQWPGRNRGKPLHFCAPEGVCLAKGVTPVIGVRGKATMSTKCSSGAVPGESLVTFSSLRKSLAARRRRNPPVRNEPALSSPPHPSGLTASHLPPQGEGFWGVGPQGEGLRGTERFPQFLNTKTPVPER